MGPFMSQKTINLIFFTDHGARTFFLLENQSVSTLWTVFPPRPHSSKSMFNPFVNIFMTKTCFSIHIIHFSVNFTWLALLNN